jgi:pantoate--beta-alanine ligase
VVAKLFHIVSPDFAIFGQKDAAQVAVLRRMVRDLDFPLELVVAPIVREADGLAMSSRNAYLSPEERRQGLVLSRSLHAVEALAAKGERSAEKLRAAGLQTIASEPAVKVDYFEIADAETLEALDTVAVSALVAVAAWVGSTRLIDNLLLTTR